MSIEKLKAEQQDVIARASALNKLAANDNRDLSADEKSEFDSLVAQVENFNTRIAREEQLQKLAETYKPVSNGRLSKPQEHETPAEEIHSDISRYSLVNAIDSFVSSNYQKVSGLEGEVSQEIAKRKGMPAQGFYIPNRQKALRNAQEKYDLNITTGVGALQNVTDYPDFIELLRNSTYVTKLGARMMTGLKGNFLLPRQSAPSTAYWTSGDSTASISTSNQTVNQVSLPQRTLGASTVYSRQLLHQVGNFDVEAFVRADLMKVLAIEIDRAVLNGSGSGSIPTGILQDSGNNAIVPTADTGNGGVLSFSDIINFETQMLNNNVELDDTVAWLTTPALRQTLKTTAKIGSTYPQFIWGDDGTMMEHKAFVSNNMPANLTKGTGTSLQSIILAKWSEVIIGTWGDGIDIIVNPYSLDTYSGAVRVTTLVDTNFCFRHEGSFSKCVSAHV